MKSRYYLRGLGIGIIVTVIIMHFAYAGRRESLSDAEIMERASKLGMVESTVLSTPAEE